MEKLEDATVAESDFRESVAALSFQCYYRRDRAGHGQFFGTPSPGIR